MSKKPSYNELEEQIKTLVKDAAQNRKAADRFRNLYETMNEGVALHEIVYDDNSVAVDYIIKDVNRAYSELTDIDRKKSVSSLASELYGSGEPPYLEIFSKVADTGEPFVFESYFPPMDKHFSISVFSPEKGEFVTVFTDISAKKKSDNALRDSKNMLQSIFRAAPVGIGMVSNRILQWTNKKLEEMSGYSQEEMIGKSARILYPNEEEFNRVGKEKYKQINELGTGTVETLWKKKSGKVIDVLLSSTPLDTEDLDAGVTFTALDISVRKRSERALVKSESLYRSLMENINLGVTLIDREHTIVMANKTQGDFFDRNPQEFIGKKCFKEFERRKLVCDHCPGTLAMRTGEVQEIETEGVRDDGNTFTVKIKAFPVIDDNGHANAFIEIVEDITEQKKAEAEKLRMEKQLLHVQKLESLGVLAGGIAHDFNNLLMAILGNADLALMNLSEVSPVRDNILAIEKVSRRAADLCKQMLAYSGKGKFVVTDIDLNEIVQEMTHMLEVSISKKAALKFNFAEITPVIKADVTQIRQILMNLIVNASEAIGKNNGIISISTGFMECDRKYLAQTYIDDGLPAGTYAFIEVADTGIGMDEKTRTSLFDPFFTTKFTGRGLGMSAVLGIVRSHQGAIRIYSEPNIGTTIKVLFPFSESSSHISLKEKKVEDNAPWQGLGTILLVDDEEILREVGKNMLEHLGFSVLTAANGLQAVELFKEHSNTIVCVLLDLTMPKMDGEQAFRELRRIKNDVRIIISSGYNEQEATQHFVGKGLAGFIQKPYQLVALKEKLQEVLSID